MSDLYPLKFKTIFKEKLWGGQKIKTILGKEFGELDNCGETWELSGVPGNVSEVSNGHLKGTLLSNLVSGFKSALVGESIYEKCQDEFPLLIKYIDAAEDLSVQVHPDDELAKKRHNCKGKAEMWYILQSDENASLINGFEQDISKEEYLKHFNSGEILKLLHNEKVEKGEVYYLPPGRIHTIGKGLLLAEIQQTSDITYRIYDFDRQDKEGNKRELQTDLALDAIDFSEPKQIKSEYKDIPNEINNIVSSPFFITNKLTLNRAKQMSRVALDCFKIYIGVRGSGKIGGESIQFGDVVLVPAIIKSYVIEPDGELELLETYIEL